MTDQNVLADAMQELRFALAGADAEGGREGLGAEMLSRALSRRPAGRPTDRPAQLSGLDAFAQASRSLLTVLSALQPAEWQRHTIRQLDVQGLVGHLIGVERDFLVTLRNPGGPKGSADHVAATERAASAQAGRRPSATVADWRQANKESVAAVRSLLDTDPGLESPLVLHGINLPLRLMLVVRAFELWTHEEDVRRAVGLPLEAPPPGVLRLMADLAVDLLPLDTGGTWAGRRARLVLTGPAGGAWTLPGEHSPGGGVGADLTDVRVVIDTADFCRVVANRWTPEVKPLEVSGDSGLAERLFEAAASLALD